MGFINRCCIQAEDIMGMEVDMDKLFGTLYNKTMEGGPLFVRSLESKFILANFMRKNLYT